MTRTTTPAPGRVRSLDDAAIAYERVGDGPPLVVVDGAGCWRGVGPSRALAAALATDFEVVTYDRRGRGASEDVPPYSVDLEVEDLAAIVEQTGPACLLGLASGGLLALRAAAGGVAVPGIVVVDPPAGPGVRLPPGLRAGLDALLLGGRPQDAARLHELATVPPQRRTPPGPALATLAGIAATLAYDALVVDSARFEHLSLVRVPVLVLDSAGTPASLRDPRVPLACVARGLPHGTYRRLPAPPPDLPDGVLAGLVSEFLLPPTGLRPS